MTYGTSSCMCLVRLSITKANKMCSMLTFGCKTTVMRNVLVSHSMVLTIVTDPL